MTKSRSQAKNTIEPQKEAGADLTHVYTLIHSFLKERSHTKAASALKNAVNGIVNIDDAAVHDGPTLQKILEEWKELKAATDAMDTSSSDSSSDSSDESSSEDDSETENMTGKSKSTPSDSSDDSSDDSDASHPKATQRVANSQESQRDSSKTLSSEDVTDSDEESTDEEDSDSGIDSDVDMDSSTVPTATEGSKRKALQVKKPATSSSGSTSSSSSDSSSSEDDQVARIPKRKARPSSSSNSSSSSDSSDSDSDEDGEPPTTKKSMRKAASSSSDSASNSSAESDTSESSSSESGSEDVNVSKKRAAIQATRNLASSSSSSSQSEDELAETPVTSVKPDPDARATKKLRANEEGAAIITESVTAKIQAGNGRGGKASRKPNTPFQRVNIQAVNYYDDKLKDNTFESRGAHGDDYGARANRDLIVTRGDGFRKEKNKKKRGSYRGGDITLHSHSFKFED